MPEEGATRVRIPWGRLTAEFVVIVVGVLVALAADAMWDSRQDRVRAEEYLTQARIDLVETQASLERAIASEDSAGAHAQRLIAGLAASTPPAPDSLRAWFLLATYTSSGFSPVLGTINALINTGDLDLIESTTLRARLLDYQNASSAVDRISSMTNPVTTQALARIGQVIPLPGADPRFSEVQKLRIDWGRASSGPGVLSDLMLITVAARNRGFWLNRMHVSLAELLAEVDVELQH